jgi:hypothetical protein
MNWLKLLLGFGIDLPVDDTRDDLENWVKKEPEIYHIRFINNTQRTIQQGEMVIAYPWCGIADQDVEDGHEGTIYVQEGILVQSARIASGSTFTQEAEAGSIAAEIWYSPVTRNYYDTQDVGRYLVGRLREATNANGAFAFEKYRYVTAGIES